LIFGFIWDVDKDWEMALNDFLSGAATFGFLIISPFFLRFWRCTRDELFLLFSAAFCLLAIAQANLTRASIRVEEGSWVYILRLAAFVLSLPSSGRTELQPDRNTGLTRLRERPNQATLDDLLLSFH